MVLINITMAMNLKNKCLGVKVLMDRVHKSSLKGNDLGYITQ
jgi:hypothetical protein